MARTGREATRKSCPHASANASEPCARIGFLIEAIDQTSITGR